MRHHIRQTGGILGALRPMTTPGHNGHARPPTMTPAEAAIFDLVRIARKAAAALKAQGVTDVGAPIPRGFRGVNLHAGFLEP